VTRLANGRSLVRRLVEALQRRRRTGRDGALLAVVVFDRRAHRHPGGNAGVNEMWITLAEQAAAPAGRREPGGALLGPCFVGPGRNDSVLALAAHAWA
jgi:hypothetical protein